MERRRFFLLFSNLSRARARARVTHRFVFSPQKELSCVFNFRRQNRRAKALEREHYSNKLASLELATEKLAMNDKATDKAKLEAKERVERNRTKAFEADEAVQTETALCKMPASLLLFSKTRRKSVWTR